MIAVKFLGWEGSPAEGVAFFIAAFGGEIVVAIAGGARILSCAVTKGDSARTPADNHHGRAQRDLKTKAWEPTGAVEAAQ